MKEQQEYIFRFIDGSEALALELETELTKRPAISPESGGRGELDKALFLEAWLKNKGITHLERHDAPDQRAKGGVRPNLVATIPGKTDSPRLWIMSHLDVVPPGELSLWASDPWTVIQKDGLLIGRGVEDNQQGLTSSVLAALALIGRGITPPHTVKLLFAADEESGSDYGVVWLLKNRGLFGKDDMVLIPDSGDAQGETIEIAEKNLLWMKFTVNGVQTHGSRPDQGANAHLAGSALALALHYGLSEAFPARDPLFEQPHYSTFEPTKREANVPNINTIPGEDVLYMDMRILPCYPLEDVLAEIDRIKAETAAKHRVTITSAVSQAVQSRATPEDAPLVGLLKCAVEEVYRVKARTLGIGGGTVAAPLRNAGISAAVWCRIEHTAHQPNEYAAMRHILGDAKVMALLMLAERAPHHAH
ncbi:MAG: M20 family metallo-hydrolase [Spirochaetaceae bacterium]|jgi:succinyl-diaminopimelate desuccinylase|nr:M20 family metallo-hydrolase [Spirochaetaceae bacterium]